MTIDLIVYLQPQKSNSNLVYYHHSPIFNYDDNCYDINGQQLWFSISTNTGWLIP